MLKVECESCKAPYQVDERRVPATGLKMRCPKCGHSFLVKSDGETSAAPVATSATAAAPSAPSTPALPKMSPKMTMVGVGTGAFALGGAAAKLAPSPSTETEALGDAMVSEVREQAQPLVDALPESASMPQLGGNARVPLKRTTLDHIPAQSAPVTEAFEVPSLLTAKKKLVLKKTTIGQPAVQPPPAQVAAAASVAEMNWDEVPAPAPAQHSPDMFATMHLPKQGGEADFGGFDAHGADLPSPQSAGLPAHVAAGLPAHVLAGLPSHVAAGLPSHVQAGLPSHVQAGLPSHAGVGLPAMMQAGLPATMQAGLPATVQAGLPSPHQGFSGFGEIDLPSAHDNLPSPQDSLPMNMMHGDNLPSAANMWPEPANSLPMTQESLPSAFDDPTQHVDSFDDSGLGGLPDDGYGEPTDDFGAFDGGEELDPNALEEDEHGPNYGEVDLAGDGDGVDLDDPLGMPAAGGDLGEARLDFAAPKVEQAVAPPKKTSHLPKIAIATLVLVVAGGISLQFTPVGAFGNLAISDAIRAKDYARLAQSQADEARAKLAADVFTTSRAAVDSLTDQKRRAQRARALSAYATFAEFESQVRFGGDVNRASAAKVWLREIPDGPTVRFYNAALAAQEALDTPDTAIPKVDEAIQALQGDPIVGELQVLKGHLQLRKGEPDNAIKTFTAAIASGMAARANYGLALTYARKGDWENAKKAAEAALKTSPDQPGATVVLGQAMFELDPHTNDALPLLGKVTEGPLKGKTSPSELALAYTARGWVLLGKDRAGEARTMFKDAVALDQRSSSALIGLGEVCYQDGLYTEASTRFDEASKLDPKNEDAIIGSAKSKIALEKLDLAKKLLAEGVKTFPKSATVRVWSGRVEEVLNNKKGAEEHYVAAVDLVNPKAKDAMLPYTALATLLAQQGRAKEAAEKLDLAKQQLPDSPALQRSLGEVAAAQGQFGVAIAHYNSALDQDPTDLGARFRLGTTYRRVGKIAEAEAEYDKVLAVDKDYPGLALERGILYEESGHIERAIEQFRGALAKAPNDLDLQLRVGAAYVAVGAVDEALPILKKVADQKPNSGEVNHYLGRAYLKRGGIDVPVALNYLKRAVELDPNRAEYHLYLAWAANESNPAQLGDAKTHVEKALQLDSLLADGYWQQGVVRLRMGRTEDAIKDLNRALELKPTRYEAYATLAECYEAKSDYAASMAAWARAIQANDKPAYWRYRYGKMLAEKGNAASAEPHLSYAVQVGPTLQPRPGWLADGEFQAAEVLAKVGKKTDAIEHYKLFLQFSNPDNPDRRDAIKALKGLGVKWEGNAAQ